MLKSNKILAALLVVTATCSIVTAILPPSNPFDRFDYFEEDTCYAGSKKSCSPSRLDTGIKCSAINANNTVPILGGLVRISNYF